MTEEEWLKIVAKVCGSDWKKRKEAQRDPTPPPEVQEVIDNNKMWQHEQYYGSGLRPSKPK